MKVADEIWEHGNITRMQEHEQSDNHAVWTDDLNQSEFGGKTESEHSKRLQ